MLNLCASQRWKGRCREVTGHTQGSTRVAQTRQSGGRQTELHGYFRKPSNSGESSVRRNSGREGNDSGGGRTLRERKK